MAQLKTSLFQLCITLLPSPVPVSRAHTNTLANSTTAMYQITNRVNERETINEPLQQDVFHLHGSATTLLYLQPQWDESKNSIKTFVWQKEQWMFSWSPSFSFPLSSSPFLFLSPSFLPSLYLSPLCVHRNALLRAQIKETKGAIDKYDSVPIHVCACARVCVIMWE